MIASILWPAFGKYKAFLHTKGKTDVERASASVESEATMVTLATRFDQGTALNIEYVMVTFTAFDEKTLILSRGHHSLSFTL